MKNIFKTGDTKTFQRIISPQDVAAFDTGTVHPVYATFALTRDAEWCSRLFVLDMKDENEEGIGTFVQVTHHSPALVGDTILFEATIDELRANVVNCTFTARVAGRLIAEGKTGQKILLKQKIEQLFQKLKND